MQEQDNFLIFRRTVIHALLLLGIATTIAFLAMDWWRWYPLGAVQRYAAGISCGALLLLWTLSRRYPAAYVPVAVLATLLGFAVFTTILIFAPYDELRAVWFFIGIGGTYILLGRGSGIAYTAASILLIVAAKAASLVPFSTQAVVTMALSLAWCSGIFYLYTTQAFALYRRVADSESHFRRLTEDIHEIVWREDREGRITYISPADRRLRGFAAEDVVGRHVFETLTDEGVAILSAVMEQKRPTATVPMKCRDGSTIWFDVSCREELDAQGNVVGYHGISRDATERLKVESKLKESEERYRLLVETANEGIGVVADGVLRFINPKLCELFGYRADELLQQPFLKLIHADDQEKVRAEYQKLLQAEPAPFMYEIPVLTKSQEMRWFQVDGTKIDWQGESATLNFFTDITERKSIQAYDAFRSRILEMMAGGLSLPNTLAAIVTGIEQLHPSMLCSVLLLDEAGKHLGGGIAPSLPDFYTEAINGVVIGIGVGSCGTAAFTGERVIVEDIATHPYWADYKELAARADVGSCWSQPIRSGSNKILGTFAIYHRRPHSPSEADIVLIEQSARLASIAIEKSQSKENLLKSEAHFRMLTEGIREVVWRLDKDLVVTYVSPSDELLRGYRADEVVGKSILALTNAEGRALIETAHRQGLTSITLPMPRKGQSELWFEIGVNRETDRDGQLLGYYGVSRDITARREAEEALRASKVFVQGVLNSVTNQIAVIDDNGAIIEVNDAWRRFSLENCNDADPLRENTDVGGNYLEMCRTTVISRSRQGLSAYDGIRAVLDGRLPTFSLEYPGHASHAEQWFIMTVTPLGAGGKGAVVVHSDITERKQVEEKVRNLAYYDSLTQLPNRRMLHERLANTLSSSKRSGRYGALMLLDLDNFKPLNDEYGHAAGDLLLIEVAKRLSSSVREVDTVARLGGDEFVVVLGGLNSEEAAAREEATTVAEKIRSTLAETYFISSMQEDGKEAVIRYRCSASIGITLFVGQETGQGKILNRADAAMYQAKEAGRNSVRVYQ